MVIHRESPKGGFLRIVRTAKTDPDDRRFVSRNAHVARKDSRWMPNAESLIQTRSVPINGMSRSSEGGADCSHEEASAAPHR